MRLQRITLLFAAALAVLGYGLTRPGPAEVYSDPVSKVRAQDETEYANSAIRMATEGGWGTPRFMGRYLLVKPPLLIWLSASSMKLLGVSLFAFRLPALLAGAFATVLLVLWAARSHSWWAAAATGLFLVANPLWHTFSRIAYTDILLAAAMTSALGTLACDPGLEKRASIVVFGASLAAGIMAKNAAGILPVFVLAVLYLLTRRRPGAGVWKALALAALLAAPWHIYQVMVHGQWFWADYVKIQLLAFGLNPPAQPAPEGHAVFYLKRLWLTDPVLSLGAAAAVPVLLRAVWQRKAEAALLTAWIGVVAVALAAFQYRNLPYLLQLIPPLSLVAAEYSPLAFVKWRPVMVVVLGAAFCGKASFAQSGWGLSYTRPAPLPAAAALLWYAELDRANELIAVDSDDEFYAAVLPLPRVRYCFIDPNHVVLRYAPHYGTLGITVSAAQFGQLDRWEPQFLGQLRDWGLDSTEPIATGIYAESAEDVLRMIATHSGSDFYLPKELMGTVQAARDTAHRIYPLSNGRFFLLAFHSRRFVGPRVWLK